MIPSLLSISASDSSSGAGMQQDIKVASDLGCWALTALTGITVQDFTHVYRVHAVPDEWFAQQLSTCLNHFRVDVIKIGTLCNRIHLQTTIDLLQAHPDIPVVLDPVLFSSRATPLLDTDAWSLMKQELFPLCQLITPNRQEFELLCGRDFAQHKEAVWTAQQKSNEWQTSILLKGGHYEGESVQDTLIHSQEVRIFTHTKSNWTYQHGTGCTLSTAIACQLALGKSMEAAYQQAVDYLQFYFTSINKHRLYENQHRKRRTESPGAG